MNKKFISPDTICELHGYRRALSLRMLEIIAYNRLFRLFELHASLVQAFRLFLKSLHSRTQILHFQDDVQAKEWFRLQTFTSLYRIIAILMLGSLATRLTCSLKGLGFLERVCSCPIFRKSQKEKLITSAQLIVQLPASLYTQYRVASF